MIIDVHQHVGHMPVVGDGAPPDWDANFEKRIKFMDRFGIDQAIVFPSNAGPATNGAEDRRRENDLVAAYIKRAPERFPATAGAVHPADGDIAMHELERCMEEPGFVGMVWHHRFFGVPIDHPGMEPLLTRLEELDGIAFVHITTESGLEAPWRLEIIAERHPDLRFVALGGFATFQHASWMLYIAKRHPNIWFDTAPVSSVSHRFLDFIREFGPDRLLLGTDNYCDPFLFGMPYALEEIRSHLDLPADVIAKILGGNAQKLLGLDSSTP